MTEDVQVFIRSMDDANDEAGQAPAALSTRTRTLAPSSERAPELRAFAIN